MAKIDVRGFQGERPKIAERLIEHNQATLAEGCDLLSGDIRAWKSPKIEQATTIPGEVKTIHKYGDDWLQWDVDVDILPSPIGGDTTELMIFTSEGDNPRAFDNTMANTGGSGVYPENTYILGIPAPQSAPGVALAGTPTGNPVNRSYVYTFVRKWSGGKADESPPSPSSIILAVEDGHTVDLSSIGVPQTTEYGVTHVWIYRTATAGGVTTYQFVAEIPINTSTYNDSIDDLNLGEELQSTEYDPPPWYMRGIVSMPNQTIAGFARNEVLFCEPGQFHAWPVRYRRALPYEIVALGVIGNTLVVATTETVTLIIGTTPGSMSEIELPGSYPCVSKRGLVSAENAVYFPSASGLAVVTSSQVSISTRQTIRRDDWLDFHPEGITATFHDGRYYGFFKAGNEQGCLLLDFNEGHVTRLKTYATAVYTEPETDTLHTVIQSGFTQFISTWNQGDDPQYFTWNSKLFETAPMSFARAQVITEQVASYSYEKIQAVIDANQQLIDDDLFDCGDIAGHEITAYDVSGDCLLPILTGNFVDSLSFRLYADDELVYEKKIFSDDAFPLPSGKLYRTWKLGVSGNRNVKEIKMATSSDEL